jgi:branched-chain amino acid transport system substrate-binding protein
MRRPFIRVGAVALACGLLATACGSGDGDGGGGGDGADAPLKVVLVTPSSGALAIYGAAANDAWKYAVDEVNKKGGVDGRKVELDIKDTDGTPAKTIQQVREGVQKDGAHFIGGIVTSSEYGALNEQLKGLNALAFSTGKAAALTAEGCNDNLFRVVASDQMETSAVASELGNIEGDKWAILAIDEAIGHSGADIFKKAAEDAGKEIVYEDFPPRGETEFGTYITALQDSGADALFAMEQGADAVAFVNQAEQFGLLDQFKSTVGIDMVTPPLFEALGDRVVGDYSNLAYDVTNPDPVNAAFVKGFTASTGAAPYFVQASNYTAAQLLFAAVEKAGSVDPGKVHDALEGLSIDTPYGEAEMRAEDHQLLVPANVAQVIKTPEGGLGFEVVSTADADVTTPDPSPACKF